MQPTKPGRGRRYCVAATAGIANAELAALAGALDELLARHRDLIEDLPGTALTNLPAGLGNTLAGLTRHMAWAEATWISALRGERMPAELEERLTSEAADHDAAALLALCDEVRAEITRPALANLAEPMAVVVAPDGRRLTPRGLLQHLLWHWTYHGGQCGLLRRLSGHPYRWSFDEAAFGA